MANKSRSYDYIVENRISELADLKKHEIGFKEKRKVTKGEIYKTIASYCGVSDSTIMQIIKPLERGGNYPSLPLGMKIAEYFNISIEDVFKLKEKGE